MIKNKLGKPISQRQLRVGEMIKQSLGMIFVKNEAKVPNLETNSITVTEVKMSQDLKVAKVFVLPLGGKDAEEKIEIPYPHQVVQLKNELSLIGPKEKSFSELIVGLPNETRKSHIEANRKLIDLDFEVWNYNLHLLPGTEMDDEESRKNYFKKTGWRLHDNAYGIYHGEKVFEGQETVTETNTLSVEDFRYFRYFHFLQQMMLCVELNFHNY